MTYRGHKITVGGFLMVLCLLTLGARAQATANYTYKKGEYVVVEHGVSPDKRWSIATHGDGEMGYDNFHVYLFAEPRHKKIGPLTEIEDILDTAASAYEAVWSPDSRHVAIFWRRDRHYTDMILYRIENGRAYRVNGPTLLDAVTRQAGVTRAETPEVRSRYFTLKWKDGSHFTLTEDAAFRTNSTRFRDTLGKFGDSEKIENAAPPDPVYLIYFAAIGDGALTGWDRWRVTNIRPGTFEK